MRTAIARLEPVLPVAAGCALLAVRPTGPVPLLAAVYAALGAMSLAAPVPRPRAPLLHPIAGLALGFGAVALAPAFVGIAPDLKVAGPAVVGLLVGGAVAEEALFRRVMYGRLERYGAPIAIVTCALAFAGLHVPMYGVGAFPVDLGAALLFGWQRWATGSWLVPAATHAWANIVAVIA